MISVVRGSKEDFDALTLKALKHIHENALVFDQKVKRNSNSHFKIKGSKIGL
jgi:hypothetical protein